MTVGDSHVVLELFNANPLARVHAADELVRGFGLSVAEEGLCHSLPISQAEQVVTGVKFQNLILPGEVVR